MEKRSVIAVDPGPSSSGLVVWNGAEVQVTRFMENPEILNYLKTWSLCGSPLVIEMIANMGMPAGESLFMSCVWIGRFMEAYGAEHVTLMPRKDVKMHLCGTPRAKDGNVRQAILDRWGGKDKAIGRKASPGPFYGVSGHLWQALALGITWLDQNAFPDSGKTLASCG